MLQNSSNTQQSHTERKIEQFIRDKQHNLFNESKIDPKHVFPNSGNSILHLSAKYGNTVLTSSLVTLGCNVNIQNRRGYTPLMVAVLQEKILQVKLLLEAKSDIHVTNVDGDSALKLALKSSDNSIKLAIMTLFLEQVKSTAANSEEIVTVLTEVNCSLTCAVILKDLEVIKLMLQQGQDINDNNFYNGWTALHVAVTGNNDEMVRLLVERGCDVSVADVFGYIPLIYMLSHNMVQCSKTIKALMPSTSATDWTDFHPGGSMQLRTIFVMGTKKTLQLFLQSYRVDLKAKDKKGMTPLHYLVSNSNDGIFDLYQDFDFNINACDKAFNKTALHVAATRNNVQAVRFLLDKGANIETPDYRGYTPLFYTITRATSRQTEYQKCIELFVQHGANLQVVTTQEDTIYKIASVCQNYDLVKPMLAHLAINEAAGEPIKRLILDQIESNIHFKRHYILCKKELMKMKMKPVCGTVTLLNILIDNENKVVLYAKRKDNNFNSIMNASFVSYSYYAGLLRKRFDKANQINELRKRAASILIEAIIQLKMNDLIVNKIIEFLSYRDLLKFS